MQQLAAKLLLFARFEHSFGKQVLLQAAFLAVINVGDKVSLCLLVTWCESQSSGEALSPSQRCFRRESCRRGVCSCSCCSRSPLESVPSADFLLLSWLQRVSLLPCGRPWSNLLAAFHTPETETPLSLVNLKWPDEGAKYSLSNSCILQSFIPCVYHAHLGQELPERKA